MKTRHTLTHGKPPVIWQDGFPLGNGVLGAMVWGDGNPLAFSLDCSELWDLRINTAFRDHPDYSYAGLRRLVQEGRFDEAKTIFETREWNDNPITPTKISVGRMELALGAVTGYEGTLDLQRAAVAGTITTGAGTHRFQCFVHHDRPLLCLKVDGVPADGAMRYRPLAELCPGMSALQHPAPQAEGDGHPRLVLQSIPGGLHYAVAWGRDGSDSFFVALGLADTADAAATRARTVWMEAVRAGFDRLRRAHIRAWKKFWSVSSVHLPEERMEFLWRYGIYLLASAARRGACPPGLQGVWAMDGVVPPWRGDYHADMNVQETFWPACATGHLDLLDVWCDHMQACSEAARAFTRRFFGTDGTFWLCCTMPKYTSAIVHWYTVQFAWSHSGWLGWLVWLRWRYSMDIGWLKATGYPLLGGVFTFYRSTLEAGSDGKLHVPLSSSPEYEDNRGTAWCSDACIDLALVRSCCRWIAEMESALGLNEHTPSAREICARLAPYPLTDKQELCLWPGKLLDESHRHPSHLMAIHPAMDLTIEGGDQDRAIIAASIRQYQALGQYRWAGHTYAQLISMAAVLGRAAWAYESLTQFADHWIMPNGLHCNADLRDSGMSVFRYDRGRVDAPFTLESNCAVAAGISDMLVQGWGDILRIFPAVPEEWRDAAFSDLLAEGAFRVSAIRRDGQTIWVRVVAGVARNLRLRNPFGTRPIVTTGPAVRRENDLLIADLAAGEALTVCGEGGAPSLRDAVRRMPCGRTSYLGL